MKKLLKDLSVEECYEMYNKVILNSNRLWKSAGVLANDGDYGGAINKLITSIEELVKAIIMLADAKGFEFRKSDGMQSIIQRSHSIRHLIGYAMFIFNIFIDDLKKVFIKIKQSPEAIIELSENEKLLKKKGKLYILRKTIIIKRELAWFSKVEKIRQQATYVDLEDEIITPLNLTVKDYNEVYKRLSNVRMVGKEFIESFNSDDKFLIKQITKLQKQFKDEGWYDNIVKAIKSTKNGKKNPFELFGENFKKFDLEGLKEEI